MGILGGLLGDGGFPSYERYERDYRAATSLHAQQAAQEAAFRAQMQQAIQNQYIPTTTSIGTGITITSTPTWYTTSDKFQIKYDAKEVLQDPYAPTKGYTPPPESNLDWLDRRVREMRVKL